MPTQQTKYVAACLVMKCVVYLYVWSSSWSWHNQGGAGAVQ